MEFARQKKDMFYPIEGKYKVTNGRFLRYLGVHEGMLVYSTINFAQREQSEESKMRDTMVEFGPALPSASPRKTDRSEYESNIIMKKTLNFVVELDNKEIRQSYLSDNDKEFLLYFNPNLNVRVNYHSNNVTIQVLDYKGKELQKCEESIEGEKGAKGTLKDDDHTVVTRVSENGNYFALFKIMEPKMLRDSKVSVEFKCFTFRIEQHKKYKLGNEIDDD